MLMGRRNFCWMKMHEAHSHFLYWQNAFQHHDAMLAQQPLLQFNPYTQVNPHLEVNPITQVNPNVEVNPQTQINPHVLSGFEVNPQTQVNPHVLSGFEISPQTQAYFNFDPDLNVNIGNSFK